MNMIGRTLILEDLFMPRLRLLPPCFLFAAAAFAAPPELDIAAVEAGRVGEEGLGFRITYGGTPDPARVRIFFDTDPARGEPGSGADYMVEGSTLYAYPAGGEGWKWDLIGMVSFSVSGNTLTCIISDAAALNNAKIQVQSTTPAWDVAAAWPAAGLYQLPDRASLPEFAPAGDGGPVPEAVDLAELIAAAPKSLSVRFEGDYLGRKWAPLQSPGHAQSPPLVFWFRDAATGKVEDMIPRRTLADGKARLLEGTTAGLDWEIVVEPGDGGVTATGRIHGEGERCFSVSAGMSIDPAGWTWHDDVRESRLVHANGKPFATMAGSPYGPEGQVSIYPFGVLSRGDRMLMAETDPAEPRVFRIAADPARKTLGVTWDLAVSPATKKFPGAATFRAHWSERKIGKVNAFRAALEAFYGEHPDFARNRAKTAGLWMPFEDISRLPRPEDFGFAFFEKVGDAGADVQYAYDHGVLTLRYTEPWLYWLPMPAGMPRTPETAGQLMRQTARLGSARPNALAASGLLGGVREPDGARRMKFLDVPWNSGARMEVSTDPELAPTKEATLNRAMAEWKDIQGFLADPRVDGIYLDSMSAMLEMDYNPAAIAVADYPQTFTTGQLKPGLSTQIAAYEFTSALGHWLHARDKLVMGNFPVYDFPFFMPFIDVPGEETVWFAGGKYAPMKDAKLNYRRAMSGRKVWCFLLGAKFEDIPEGGIERYFTDCLFFGFQPGLFSHNGADDTYWSNTSLYERDRPLFKKYLPLASRFALAGWRPLGAVRAADEKLWVENYGDGKEGAVLHAGLRNATGQPLRTTVAPAEGVAERLVVFEPLTGVTSWLAPGEETPVELAGGQLRAWDIFPVGSIDREIAFLKSWEPPEGEAEAGRKNLESVRREAAADLYCRVRLPGVAVSGEPNKALLEVRNAGQAEVTLDGFGASGAVPAGGTVTREAAFTEAGPGGWLDFSWTLRTAGGETIEAQRRVRTEFAAAVGAGVDTERVVSRTSSAAIGVVLTNRSSQEKKAALRWGGDFAGGTTEETLAGGESRTLQLPVAADGRESGFVTLAASADGKEILEKKIYVLFAGPNASAASVSGVQVITDSTYPGYATVALTDGTVDGTNLAWNEAAWASDDNGQPHFVRIVLPEPTELAEASIHWQQEGGVRYTSQRGSLVGVTAEGESVDLGSFENARPAAVTKITFPKRKWRSIELRQPANSGPKGRPGILWLSEFELK